MEFTVKTQWVDYDSIRLYGKIYVPQTAGKHPAAIIAHGFTGDHSQMAMYARSLAEKGFVAYVFDFPGGGYNVASTGRDSEHVSIASEQSDLEAALNYIRNRDDVDTDRVYLAGASLGGVVAALTAAAHSDQVRALALLYPAFNIEDDAEGHFISADQVPAGGSISGSRSQGKSTDMSVLTEVADLKNVINAAEKWDFVDTNRIYLHGGSQGGLVTAIAGAQEPEHRIAGLILAYPAFIIRDQLHHDYPSLSAVPEHFRYIDWIDVSKKYATDMWNYDIYGEIAKYTGPVLILHGDEDHTVPMRYSQRAQRVYQHAQLKVIPGGGHEFFGRAFNEAAVEMEKFFVQQKVIK